MSLLLTVLGMMMEAAKIHQKKSLLLLTVVW